jgi:endoglucanase
LATHIRTALGIVVLGLFLVPSAWAGSVGSWSPLPSMSTPRYAAAAATLSDGRVLVAGGQDGSGNATASAEIYDPTTNAWSAAAPMGSARVYAAAAPLPGDRVLVTGGDVGGATSASTEIYDGTTDTWSPAAPMEYARADGAAVAMDDGTVWVLGGGPPADNAERYDPGSGTWSYAPYIYPYYGAVAVRVESGSVFYGGGELLGSPGPTNSIELASSSGSEIEFGEAAPPVYQGAGAALPGGSVLVAGGLPWGPSPSALAAAEIYDPTLTPTPAAPMATPRYGAVAASLPDGRVLVAGGDGGSGALASAEVFSPPPLAAPVNTSPPQIWDAVTSAGPVHVGDLLQSGGGVWTGNDPLDPQYQYQWQVCRPTCADPASITSIDGGSVYTITPDDAGAMLRLVVTSLHGTVASAAVVSNEIGPVSPPGYHLSTIGPSDYPLLWRGDLKYFWVSVGRDVASGPGQVSFRIWDPNAGPHPTFTPIAGVLPFADGQATVAFPVPVQDNGVPILVGSLAIALSGGSPIPVGDESQVTIPMVPDPSVFTRDPSDPLGLGADSRSAANPLAGAAFFADYFQSLPGRIAVAWSAGAPALAAKVAVIAREPNVQRFGAWNGLHPGWDVATYLNRAAKEEPGTVPMISTYRVVSGHCTRHWSDPLLAQSAYHTWITSLAEGIGTHPAVLFLEMDSLITAGCLSPAGVTVRMHELHDAINVLSNDPHLVVYLDAGAADALPARYTASLLRRAGVAGIQGFFLNSTHFDWTSREIRYGQQISRLVGGKHFVVNTAENGQGPLRPRHVAREGNEVLCDPVGRGLGPLPTASTGYPKVDAFAWIANPGVSGGQCRAGAPPSGVFWPSLALELVRHEDFRVR